MKRASRRRVSIIQGLYFLVAGIWPLVSMNSFPRVTGPKGDLWLVITVGLLLAVIGSVLICAGINNRTQVEFFLLGVGTSVCIAVTDIVFVLKGAISPIYLLDGLIESVWSVLWIRALKRDSDDREPAD
jgi:uncharacterized integral membrane protein